MGRAGPGRAGWNGMGAAGIDMGERMGGVWAGPGRGRISASKPADTRALRRYSAHLPPLHLAPLRPRGPLSTRSPTFPDLHARTRAHSHSQVRSPGPVPARFPIRPPTDFKDPQCRLQGTAGTVPTRSPIRPPTKAQGCSNRESRESRGAKKKRFGPNREALNKIPNRLFTLFSPQQCGGNQ